MGNPLQWFCLENPHGTGGLAAIAHRACRVGHDQSDLNLHTRNHRARGMTSTICQRGQQRSVDWTKTKYVSGKTRRMFMDIYAQAKEDISIKDFKQSKNRIRKYFRKKYQVQMC